MHCEHRGNENSSTVVWQIYYEVKDFSNLSYVDIYLFLRGKHSSQSKLSLSKLGKSLTSHLIKRNRLGFVFYSQKAIHSLLKWWQHSVIYGGKEMNYWELQWKAECQLRYNAHHFHSLREETQPRPYTAGERPRRCRRMAARRDKLQGWRPHRTKPRPSSEWWLPAVDQKLLRIRPSPAET